MHPAADQTIVNLTLRYVPKPLMFVPFVRFVVSLVPGDGGAGCHGPGVPPATTVALHRRRGRCRASLPGRVIVT